MKQLFLRVESLKLIEEWVRLSYKKGSKDRYFQSGENDSKKLVPEGIVGRVAYKGTLSEVSHQIIGGLKSGMGYCGAENIEKLLSAKFVKITSSGITKVILIMLLLQEKLQIIVEDKLNFKKS